MQKKIMLSLTTALLVSSLQATIIELEPISITSTAIKTDELKATDAVEVYTQKDIEQAHVQNLYEFLNQQTSIVTMPSFGNPFLQKIDMRGYGIGDGYQNIVITINGRKMNNIDMVSQFLSSISPSSISRIEIIKSSGIVTGGDGANAGVINITTKQNNNKEISIYGGTNHLSDYSLYLGHKDEKLSVSFSGESQKKNVDRDISSNIFKDENKLLTATFNLSYNLNEKIELSANMSATDTTVIYGGALTKAQYEANPNQQGSSNSTIQEYETINVDLGFRYYINDELTLNTTIFNEKKRSNYVTSSWESRYDYKSLKTILDYTDDFKSISVGFDGFKGDRTSSSDTTTKDNLAGFAISEFYINNSTFKAGYRYEKVTYKYKKTNTSLKDDHSLYGAELGYNYTFDKEKSFFINYSHSYQAPDIDRFFNWGGTFNAFIDPSKADNFNIGFNYITSSNKFKISAFYIDLKNEIYYYKTSFKNTNIDKSHKYGLDIYDKWLINNNFSVVLNYNYVQAIIDKEIENGENFANKKLPGVSNHNIKATLNYKVFKNTTLALTQIYRSKTYAAEDFNNNFTQKQDAYKSTDISITYTKKGLELFAKINNLFNQKNGLWIRDDAIYPINFETTAKLGLKLKF